MNIIGGNAGRNALQLSDGSTKVLVDHLNEALVVQDEIHSNIHRGIFFSATHLTLALANNDTSNILFATSGVVHLRMTVSASAQTLVEFHEDATVSASGTSIALYNRNRLSPIGSGTTGLFHDPTIVSSGTRLYVTFVPGGTKNQAIGSENQTFQEWILKPHMLYLCVCTNNSGSASSFSCEVDLYEPGLAT